VATTNYCCEIFSNFGLPLALTVPKAEQAGQHYTLSGAAQPVWEVV
jgi:hypothetical protein